MTTNGTLIVPCGGAGRQALKALTALGEPVVLRLAMSCVAIPADQN